jgi:hypothetical protein
MVRWSIPAPYDCHVDDEDVVVDDAASAVATDVESDDDKDENSAEAEVAGRRGAATA